MFFLFVTFCLVSDPSKCIDKDFTFEGPPPTPQQCIMNGQKEMAKYVVEHPGWRVSRFKCSRYVEKGV